MISYAITVADEEFEFKRLIRSIQPYLLEDEEIVILADKNKITNNIKKYANSCNLNITYFNFENNFSDFKNKLFEISTKKYIFQIDADEQIPISLIYTLRNIAADESSDLVWIPRINKLNGLSNEERESDLINNKMGWRGFPDLQARFVKNTNYIRWKGNVHEILTGSNNASYINQSPIELYSILHVKDKKKQTSQDALYSKIER